MKDAIFFNHEFINLYSEENPILESGEECFFLLFNERDYHIPIIARGIIIADEFVDGFNKQYDIRMLEFLSSPKIINKYVMRNTFVCYPMLDSNKILTKKTVQISPKFNFEKYLFRIEAFFVRKDLDEIQKLYTEFVEYLKKDLNKMISEIDEI